MKITPPTRKRQISPSSGSFARVAMRKSAAGAPASANRSAAISAGPKPARPARIAGKEEAQAMTVKLTVKTSVGSRRWGLEAARVGEAQLEEDMASFHR